MLGFLSAYVYVIYLSLLSFPLACTCMLILDLSAQDCEDGLRVSASVLIYLSSNDVIKYNG